MTEDKSDTKVDLGLLEEDDEFEEFPVDTVKAAEEDKEANVWEDNWDDDNVEDDFANQLRAMKRTSDSRSPPPLTPPPSKRKCVQSTPPLVSNGGSNGAGELDINHSLQTNGSSRRTNGRSSQSSRSSTTSTPPGSPSARGRGRSSTPSDQPDSPTPTRRSTRLRKK